MKKRFLISLLLILSVPQIATAQTPTNIAELTQKADKGDKQAQEDLGGIYIRGTGVAVDYVLARKYYLLAAAQDMTKAQHNLCYLYGGGFGVAKDINTAISWCEKSANKGFLKSQILLGDFYLDKGYTIPNVLAARNWYLKAASQNDAYSQYMVAQTYFHVPSEIRDFEIGLSWAKKSAAQNFPDGIKLKNEFESVIAENKANKLAWEATKGKPPPVVKQYEEPTILEKSKSNENPYFNGAQAIIVKKLPPRPLNSAQIAAQQKAQNAYDSAFNRYINYLNKINALIKEENENVEAGDFNMEYLCHVDSEIWSAQTNVVLIANEILSLQKNAENRARVEEDALQLKEFEKSMHSSCN